LELLGRLQGLSEKGINVTSMVSELNETLALIQDGKTGEAEAKLAEIQSSVSSLEAVAQDRYLAMTAEKYGEVIAFLSIPVLFYIFFPRIYLRIWFRMRRRWAVSEPSR